MKRKIEDYINKGEYAVLCSSEEEWNTIVDLINKNHVSTTTQPYSKTKSNVLNLQNLRVTIGTGILKSFPNYTIYPASDFLEEEPKFEVGKWYYVELGVHKHYLKFKKIDKDKAFIDKKGFVDSLKKWDYGVSIDVKKVTFYKLLTDLSEIQEYLPEGHPDKIKTEIIPEYVKLLPNFDNNNTDRIFYTKGAIPKMENWSYRSWKHLFEIHSTYFKESTKEAFDLQNKPKQLTVNDLIKGEIYVFDISSIKNFISKFDYIESDNYYDSCFIQGDDFDNDPEFATISDIKSIRLATNEEKKWLNTCISQDKFISKEDLHLYDDSGLLIWEIGCYYKLNFTDNTSTYIKLSKKVDDRIYGNEYTDSTGKWYYNEIIWSTKQLKTHEKVDKPDQKIKDMFKKDDYIYVLGGETTTGKNCKDKVLKIESVDLKSLNKPFVTTDYDECGGIYFDEIRMATTTEIDILYIHKKPEEWIPKVGDWCFTTTHYNDEIWYKGRIWKIGKIDENGFCIPIENGRLLNQSLKTGFRKALPHEIPITSRCITYNGENFQTTIYDFGDIYIAPITKKTKKLQTITIESTTDLNLNLTKIKSKQIQTIKI